MKVSEWIEDPVIVDSRLKLVHMGVQEESSKRWALNLKDQSSLSSRTHMLWLLLHTQQYENELDVSPWLRCRLMNRDWFEILM